MLPLCRAVASCPQPASAAQRALSRRWAWSTSGGTYCPPTWRPPCSAASTSSTKALQVVAEGYLSPVPCWGTAKDPSERHCIPAGWEVAGDYIYTAAGASDSDFMILTLVVPGFR